MKNIKYIFTILILALAIYSCENDGGDSNLDLKVGAVPDFTVNSDLPTILNLNSLSSGDIIDFGYSFDIARGEVVSADIVAFYQSASENGMYGPVTLVSDVTDFPADFTQSTNDLISAFPELSDNSDFKLGDQLIITAKLYLADGSTLDLMDQDGRLYGSNIHTSGVYDVVANYDVGCPLNGKFTGDYQLTVSGSGAYGAFANSGVVTLNETSQTVRTFTIPYLPGAGPFSVDVPLQFVCENLSIPTVDSGIGCGGSFKFGSTDGGIVIDPSDDSGFTINITDFIDDGGCGVSPYEVSLKFEKL